jgi:hypothetical protein
MALALLSPACLEAARDSGPMTREDDDDATTAPVSGHGGAAGRAGAGGAPSASGGAGGDVASAGAGGTASLGGNGGRMTVGAASDAGAGEDAASTEGGAAPPADAGRGDAAPGGTDGAAPVRCGDIAVCESFEREAEGPYAGAFFKTQGGKSANYVVTAERARTGKLALKIGADEVGAAGAARRFLRASLGDRLGDGKTVFARAWMYFPALPKVSRSGNAPHYRMIRFDETIAPNVGAILSAGIVGSERGRMLYFKPMGFKDCAADGAVLPANKWTCVELRSDPSGYQAWIDGRTIGGRSAVSGDQCWQRRDRVGSVSFGFELAAGELAAPLTFFMDDLALSDKRVGCD